MPIAAGLAGGEMSIPPTLLAGVVGAAIVQKPDGSCNWVRAARSRPQTRFRVSVTVFSFTGLPFGNVLSADFSVTMQRGRKRVNTHYNVNE
jgi:hypothetical protein